jgi:hypothetical protein
VFPLIITATVAEPLRPPRPGALVEQRLSVERLGAYRAAAGGDLDRAIALYEWNTAVAGAFFEVLGYFEVVLRNSLHEQLTIWHTAAGRPDAWYDDPAGLLDERRHKEIAAARDRLQSARKAETAGRIVAELNFGFWRFLLDKRYQPILWAQALRHAFPNLIPADRRTVYGPVVRLNELRNRVAHHEPIHRLNQAERHQELLEVVGLIDDDIAIWISGLSRVPALLSSRPS